MRAATVKGKRIVEVRQERVTSDTGTQAWNVICLVLEDGTRVVPSVVELGHDYAVEMTVYGKNGLPKP